MSKITRSIIEQIKQNNSPPADLIQVLNYPERIQDLKTFQGIKIGDLTNIIVRKYVCGVNPDFEKQTESAFHEVKDLRNLNPEQILNPCHIYHRIFSGQFGASYHCLLEHEQHNLPERSPDPRVQ